MNETLKGVIPSLITIVGMVLIILFAPHSLKIAAQQKQRFQQIDRQDISTSDNDHGYPLIFKVFRDTQTGQEIVCMEEPGMGDWPSPTCYLTGRKW
jgi:hypothetical protein